MFTLIPHFELTVGSKYSDRKSTAAQGNNGTRKVGFIICIFRTLLYNIYFIEINSMDV